ncbi:MAG: hypothetical protein ABWZ25_17055 [Chitinophagaceae bacterium]
MSITTSDPQYGLPIKFPNSSVNTIVGNDSVPVGQLGADAMVSQFLNVRNNYRADLEDLTGSDIHAFRYFCYDDCAYIFDVEIMRALINTIDKNKEKDLESDQSAGCVVLFQGMRKSPIDENDLSKGYSFGRPTIVATPYILRKNGDLVHKQVTELSELHKETRGMLPADGFEHPGNGNSGGSTLKQPTSRQTVGEYLPKVVEKCGEHSDTDYRILRMIEAEAIEKWI